MAPNISQHLERLAAADRWTYRASPQSATEPAAWTALAMAAHGRADDARRSAQWLASLQQTDGAVGVSAAECTPCWPTSLAIWAWTAIDKLTGDAEFESHAERAVTWALTNHGKTAPRSPFLGHNSELTGWSWAAETHSWMEPTCMFVIGLRAAGYADHPRVRAGIELIVDRLLTAGGANYGNTIVLGQALMPHIQPSGFAMLALAGETTDDARAAKSLDYLAESIDENTAPTSLALACLGLAAHGRRPAKCLAWIEHSLNREYHSPLGAYEQSLLLLAAATDATSVPVIAQQEAV